MRISAAPRRPSRYAARKAAGWRGNSYLDELQPIERSVKAHSIGNAEHGRRRPPALFIGEDAGEVGDPYRAIRSGPAATFL
jgi:hypothetical protein